MDFRKYVILLIVFLILTLSVLGFRSITTMDIAIIANVQSMMSSFPTAYPEAFAGLTYGFRFWIPALIVAIILIMARKYVSMFLMFIVVQFAYVTSDILKTIIGRVRPPMEMQVTPLTNPSFPSGHDTVPKQQSEILRPDRYWNRS